MKKLVKSVALVAVLFVTVFANSVVSAQSTGLGITPRRDVTAQPGTSESGTLFISNLNREVPLNVSLRIVDFKAADETGTPALQLAEDAPQTPWSLKPFLTVPERVQLAPNESKYIPFTIRIPENQGAGSYYSAIQYSAEAGPGGNGNVTINASGATLMFVTIPGKATELLNLKNFGAYQGKSDGSIGNFKSVFVGSRPQQLAYRLENAGSVAENPSGSIVIKNMFGKEVKTIKEANPRGNLALIGQTRVFETCIEPEVEEIEQDGRTTRVETCKDVGFWPGAYTAQLNLFYGINGSDTQEIVATATFWYLPAWFLAIIAAVFALIGFLIWRVRKNFASVKARAPRRGGRR